MANKVKYFYNPAYTSADWVAENPLLVAGQIGVELDLTGVAVNIKVGPGNWNDLEPIGKNLYSHTDLVTNPLGALVDNSSQLDRPIEDILRDIISPYASVTMADAKNDEGGLPMANNVIKEVGQTVATSVDVFYTLGNSSNLKVGSNIFIEAGGIFTNEGFHTHDGNPITMTLVSPLTPTSNVTYTINIFAVDAITGNTNTISTKITYQPAILWGSNVLQNISAGQIGSKTTLPNRLVTNNYKQTFVFGSIHYSHIYIPAMLNPANLLFSEVTNPTQPGGYAMIPTTPALISVNNGTGTYDYYGWVSEYDLILASKMKID